MPRQPSKSGPASIAMAMPAGMKQLHSAKTRSRRDRWATCSRMDGAATVISRKPAPSTMRETRSEANPPADAPSADPAAVASRPRARMRRPPMTATSAPAGMPPTSPRSAKTPVSQPMADRPSPRSACSIGAAMAALPTCRAAAIPAATISATAPQRVGITPHRACVPRPAPRRFPPHAAPGSAPRPARSRLAGGRRHRRHRPASRRHRASRR